MSLLFASILGMAQIQVFWFEVKDLFETKASYAIQDIHEGDCLRGPELESFVGVENTELYYTYECGKEYPLSADVVDHLACDLDFKSGMWQREVLEHDKPGVFFPSAVPCMSSVTRLDYSHSKFAEVAEGLACSSENAPRLVDRIETMRTKKFEIGQGIGYLPQPLAVEVREYDHARDGSLVIKSCRQSEFSGSYLGWGSFQVQWRRFDCLNQKQTAVLCCESRSIYYERRT